MDDREEEEGALIGAGSNIRAYLYVAQIFTTTHWRLKVTFLFDFTF